VSIAACIYVVADVINKVGFGIVAIQAAKVSSGIGEVAPSAVTTDPVTK
jgi:bacteriorhodopsin